IVQPHAGLGSLSPFPIAPHKQEERVPHDREFSSHWPAANPLRSGRIAALLHMSVRAARHVLSCSGWRHLRGWLAKPSIQNNSGLTQGRADNCDGVTVPGPKEGGR